MSRSQRRAMIDREEPKLSLVRQCALLGISRSSLYYLPTEAGAEDLELMALIDQQYLKPTFPIWLNIPLSKSLAFFKPLSICETLAVGMAIITP